MDCNNEIYHRINDEINHEKEDTMNNDITQYLEDSAELINKAFYEYFNIFSQFKLDGKPYILGGFLRDTLIKKDAKDLDIVVLNGNRQNILNNIKRLNLEYDLNSFGDYKISCDGKKIDIWPVNNLIEAIEFNIDGLFYDINESKFVDLGFIDAMEVNKIIKINALNHPNPNHDRTKKIIKEMEILRQIAFEQSKVEQLKKENIDNSIDR